MLSHQMTQGFPLKTLSRLFGAPSLQLIMNGWSRSFFLARPGGRRPHRTGEGHRIVEECRRRLRGAPSSQAAVRSVRRGSEVSTVRQWRVSSWQAVGYRVYGRQPLPNLVTSELPVRTKPPGKFSDSYFLGSLLSANFTAVSSASPALTFTSGSTPTSAQSDFEKGLMAFVSGMPIPK